MKKPPCPMPIEKRAKQFMPFAALTGLTEALEAKEHEKGEPFCVDDEMAEELDRKMHLLQRGILATVVYYHEREYVKITGVVSRIDQTSRILQIVQTKILFDDIVEVHLA